MRPRVGVPVRADDPRLVGRMENFAGGPPVRHGVIRPRPRRPAGGGWASLRLDLFSIEASFALFLFAGHYKNFAELRWFPVDFTLLFFGLTISLVIWAVASGRMKTAAPNTPALLMFMFSALATISVFWSSLDAINVEKAARFLLLTVTSFFVAWLISATRERRERLIRNLVYVSLVIVLYYFYSRYVLGIDPQSSDAEGFAEEGNNYLEYGEHAVFIVLGSLALGVFGSTRQFYVAMAGAAFGWLSLLLMGGRGPLALTIIALPMLAGGLLLRARDASWRVPRLAMLLAIIIGIATLGYAGMTLIGGATIDPQQFHTLDRLQSQMSGDDTRSVDMREVGQAFALSQWLERPILGWGMGEFWIERPELKWPHNLVLEILMENGVIAGFLFLALCGASALACVRLMRAPSAGWIDVAIALWVLTELISHLTAEGYLADDRILFGFMGIVLAPRMFGKPL